MSFLFGDQKTPLTLAIGKYSCVLASCVWVICTMVLLLYVPNVHVARRWCCDHVTLFIFTIPT